MLRIDALFELRVVVSVLFVLPRELFVFLRFLELFDVVGIVSEASSLSSILPDSNVR